MCRRATEGALTAAVTGSRCDGPGTIPATASLLLPAVGAEATQKAAFVDLFVAELNALGAEDVTGSQKILWTISRALASANSRDARLLGGVSWHTASEYLRGKVAQARVTREEVQSATISALKQVESCMALVHHQAAVALYALIVCVGEVHTPGDRCTRSGQTKWIPKGAAALSISVSPLMEALRRTNGVADLLNYGKKRRAYDEGGGDAPAAVASAETALPPGGAKEPGDSAEESEASGSGAPTKKQRRSKRDGAWLQGDSDDELADFADLLVPGTEADVEAVDDEDSVATYKHSQLFAACHAMLTPKILKRVAACALTASPSVQKKHSKPKAASSGGGGGGGGGGSGSASATPFFVGGGGESGGGGGGGSGGGGGGGGVGVSAAMIAAFQAFFENYKQQGGSVNL